MSAVIAPNTDPTTTDSNDPAATMHSWSNTKNSKDEARGDPNALVWEIYNRKDGLVYVICDGYREFLKEPAGPEIYNERFYPWYALDLQRPRR